MPRWKWENIWLVWTVLSLWVDSCSLRPWAAVAPSDRCLQSNSFGLFATHRPDGPVVGSRRSAFGMSFLLVGVAVGAAVGLGCAAAMGTLLPILYADTPLLQRSTGALVLVGVVMVLIGVGVCGFAGRARERHQEPEPW